MMLHCIKPCFPAPGKRQKEGKADEQ